jgi:hypothetical protein
VLKCVLTTLECGPSLLLKYASIQKSYPAFLANSAFLGLDKCHLGWRACCRSRCETTNSERHPRQNGRKLGPECHIPLPRRKRHRQHLDRCEHATVTKVDAGAKKVHLKDGQFIALKPMEKFLTFENHIRHRGQLRLTHLHYIH